MNCASAECFKRTKSHIHNANIIMNAYCKSADQFKTRGFALESAILLFGRKATARNQLLDCKWPNELISIGDEIGISIERSVDFEPKPIVRSVRHCSRTTITTVTIRLPTAPNCQQPMIIMILCMSYKLMHLLAISLAFECAVLFQDITRFLGARLNNLLCVDTAGRKATRAMISCLVSSNSTRSVPRQESHLKQS